MIYLCMKLYSQIPEEYVGLGKIWIFLLFTSHANDIVTLRNNIAWIRTNWITEIDYSLALLSQTASLLLLILIIYVLFFHTLPLKSFVETYKVKKGKELYITHGLDSEDITVDMTDADTWETILTDHTIVNSNIIKIDTLFDTHIKIIIQKP